MQKTCNGCQDIKDESAFHRMKASPDGRQSRCKECIRKYQAENRGRITGLQRARESSFRANVFAQYGGKCACCGETERAFLTFDHVNDDGAEHRRTGVTNMARWAAANGYPDTLQLLCANCNMAKQFAPGGCPHQIKPPARRRT